MSSARRCGQKFGGRSIPAPGPLLHFEDGVLIYMTPTISRPMNAKTTPVAI